MKEPKYKIGQRFYTVYRRNANDNSGYNRKVVVPCCLNITQITINKKDIVYTVKEYLKNNEGFESRCAEVSEKDMEKYHSTIHDTILNLIKYIENDFIFVEEAMAKEELSGVLNGE